MDASGRRLRFIRCMTISMRWAAIILLGGDRMRTNRKSFEQELWEGMSPSISTNYDKTTVETANGMYLIKKGKMTVLVYNAITDEPTKPTPVSWPEGRSMEQAIVLDFIRRQAREFPSYYEGARRTRFTKQEVRRLTFKGR